MDQWELTSVSACVCVCVCVGEGGWGGFIYTPLPTLAFTLKAVRRKITKDLCHCLHTWPLTERLVMWDQGGGDKEEDGGERWSDSEVLVPTPAGNSCGSLQAE